MKSGRGTFSRSPTSGATRRTVHGPCFRGRRADKNAFRTVSISNSGLELWGFEFLGRRLVWGYETRVTIYVHISFRRKTIKGTRKPGEKSKIAGRNFEQCGAAYDP